MRCTVGFVGVIFLLPVLALQGQKNAGGIGVQTALADPQPDSEMRCDSVSCVITSGEWALFNRERPPLDYVELKSPIVVRKLRGAIYSSGRKPLVGAMFQVRLPNSSVTGATTDHYGSFQFTAPHGSLGSLFKVSPGSYRFKATMDGFHSTIGTVVVSRSAPKESSIELELEPGK